MSQNTNSLLTRKGQNVGRYTLALADLNRSFACVRTNQEIQGFSHKRKALPGNKERRKTVREGNIREDNM